MPKLKEQPYQIIIALDQLFNALTWGWADETFSARCWRLKERNSFWAFCRKSLDIVLFFDAAHGMGHCERAYNYEKYRIHLPNEYK